MEMISLDSAASPESEENITQGEIEWNFKIWNKIYKQCDNEIAPKSCPVFTNPLSGFALSNRILSNLISFRPLISFSLWTRFRQFFLH